MINVHVELMEGLQLSPSEIWPAKMPVLPRVGDLIHSDKTWKDWSKNPAEDYRVALVVARIEWRAWHIRNGGMVNVSWEPHLILGLPASNARKNIVSFMTEYNRVIAYEDNKK